MAKIGLNSALTFISGSLDNWVYRKTGDGPVVAKRPVITAPSSAAQQAHRELFRSAALYAKQVLTDAQLGPRYAAAAQRVGQRPFAFAIADFFHEPVVQEILADAYHGAVGDPIDVRAYDDFEVAGVNVTLSDAANLVLEQGPAVFVDGLWRYTATTAVAVGTAVKIEAVATDRPGHTGTRSARLVVA